MNIEIESPEEAEAIAMGIIKRVCTKLEAQSEFSPYHSWLGIRNNINDLKTAEMLLDSTHGHEQPNAAPGSDAPRP